MKDQFLRVISVVLANDLMNNRKFCAHVKERGVSIDSITKLSKALCNAFTCWESSVIHRKSYRAYDDTTRTCVDFMIKLLNDRFYIVIHFKRNIARPFAPINAACFRRISKNMFSIGKGCDMNVPYLDMLFSVIKSC